MRAVIFLALGALLFYGLCRQGLLDVQVCIPHSRLLLACPWTLPSPHLHRGDTIIIMEQQ